MSKIIILTEGNTNPSDAKTATGILRYRPDDVVGILDTTVVGKTAQELLGVGGAVPCVASLADVEADTLLIGIAPAGGSLPPAWRAVVRDAISRKMDIVSGLHFFIGDDEEFRELAAEHGVEIRDTRKPPHPLSVSSNLAKKTACFRVHTVGHDCGVGKLVAAAEIDKGLRERGRRSVVIATGQTGIMIAGKGVCVDAVVSDFVAGAIESQVLEHQSEEFLLIEGQGSLVHPFYSGVTLGLLHGCAPQAMVMVFDPTRTEVRHTDMAMPPLPEIIELYERMASIITPSRVVAVALNTYALSEAEAEAAVREVREATGLPAADVIRTGPDEIVEAVFAAAAEDEKATG